MMMFLPKKVTTHYNAYPMQILGTELCFLISTLQVPVRQTTATKVISLQTYHYY